MADSSSDARVAETSAGETAGNEQGTAPSRTVGYHMGTLLIAFVMGIVMLVSHYALKTYVLDEPCRPVYFGSIFMALWIAWMRKGSPVTFLLSACVGYWGGIVGALLLLPLA